MNSTVPRVPPASLPASAASPLPHCLPRRPVALALQGGGSHGAFTWGVLDRLLEEEDLEIDSISGTSAGAMNGAVLTAALAAGGAERARQALTEFWTAVAARCAFGPLYPTAFDLLAGSPNRDLSPFYAGFDLLMRTFSPYQMNPMGIHPLRSLLTDRIDIPFLCRVTHPKLFVTATNVGRGTLKSFQGSELSAEALLASAALPFLWQAMAINGESYWDGGYLGNPSLHPLVRETRCSDILLIQVTPLARPHIPMTLTAIFDRVNEISFNATLLAELDAVARINRLLEQGYLDGDASGMRVIHLHAIANDPRMAHFTAMSKMNSDLGFLHTLRDLGRETAHRWLQQNKERIGLESTWINPR